MGAFSDPALILPGAITNTEISATAAIAKTKLAALDIVNTDVNAAAAIAISKLAAGASRIASGTYVGNSSANRAVAHGLGVVPKFIVIHIAAKGYTFEILNATIVYFTTAAQTSGGAITAWDATNFYVGNAGNYNTSANNNLDNYEYVVFG